MNPTTVKDEKFANTIIGCATRLGLNPRKRNEGKYFSVKIHGKLFVQFLKELTLEDVEKLINGYETDFLRGFYDSEGNYNKSHRHPFFRMVNTKRELLELVGKTLKKLGINYTTYINDRRPGNRKVIYGIQIARRNDVAKFRDIVRGSPKGW